MFRYAPTLCALVIGLAAAGAQAQDAESGEKVFRNCKSCHMVGDGAKNRVGPILTGVVGRPAGSVEGFRYGDSMLAAGEAGLVWDEDRLFDYLASPKEFLRDYLDDDSARAKMTFRLKDEQDRRDVIAYLATFSAPGDEAKADAPDGQVATGEIDTAANALCVRNRNTHAHFFAVEARTGARRTGALSPGERLCTEAARGATGVVSVFESENAFEGCSRLVKAGTTEDMLKYVDFDRCFWSSNS